MLCIAVVTRDSDRVGLSPVLWSDHCHRSHWHAAAVKLELETPFKDLTEARAQTIAGHSAALVNREQPRSLSQVLAPPGARFPSQHHGTRTNYIGRIEV